MKKFLFILAVSLQVFFLVGMSVAYYMVDNMGKVIKLETEPLDPQDIFYGDYITLWYEVERIPEELWLDNEKAADVEPNKKIYVLLEEGKTGVYHAKAASVNKLKAGDREAVLVGRYSYYDDHEKIHYLEYGIDRYFIEDNTGGKYEQQETLTVTVALAPWGQKRILQVE